MFEKIYGRDAKKCRNKASGLTRQLKLNEQKERESKAFNKLKRKKIRNVLKKCRLIDTTGNIATYLVDELIMSPAQIRKVRTIQFTGNGAPIELTTMKAKQFLKYVTNVNLI